MNTQILTQNLNLQSIVEFVRLTKVQKIELLAREAVLLDFDTEKTTVTRLYFLKGFFVEEIFCCEQNEIIDIIPFKQGYRIKSYIKSENSSLNERPFYFQYCIN